MSNSTAIPFSPAPEVDACTIAFGSPDRYYSRTNPAPPVCGDFESDERIGMLIQMLEKGGATIKESVDLVSKQWNAKIRSRLRDVTALHLRSGDGTIQIPVEVVDTVPNSFVRWIDEGGSDLAWWLLLHRESLEHAKLVLKLVGDRFQAVKDFCDDPALSVEPEHMDTAFFSAILSKLDGLGLLEGLKQIDEDVLGGYHFRVPTIHIHWKAVAIIASVLQVDIEGLTFVALSHLLAHAYTHRGRDIDCRAWHACQFAKTDMHIVESVAQHYTETICAHFENDFPAAMAAYRKLLMHQHPVFRAHKRWVSEDERACEIVRSALLQCREKGMISHADFIEAVERERRRVGVGKKRNPPAVPTLPSR